MNFIDYRVYERFMKRWTPEERARLAEIEARHYVAELEGAVVYWAARGRKGQTFWDGLAGRWAQTVRGERWNAKGKSIWMLDFVDSVSGEIPWR